MSKHRRFIQSFLRIPMDMFRVNSGTSIRLRAWPAPRRPHGMFDLLTTAGKVQTKALDPASYEFPNGASMRPNSRTQQNLVRTVKPRDGYTIYTSSSIDLSYAGTVLPEDLILVHEFRDHYSLQARKEMTVEGTRNRASDKNKSAG
ncbi:hypothetical protein N7517_009912 [Penicillium concentricum]|uniref:Tse2 ADP-ribosyltransferase toxin domain-containing protein n=1 Tax=Penicillium concentricum TaxID=293559 RepID=A0A9W9RIG6_9EURO|nr:uncharacterized protein N7517_009912 [Penicillium concentricum]KAJ5360721.1 hypothetical protein N7517_009912 [Penicillium concentricum]